MISAVADCVTALATLGAVIVAAIGLNTWRKQVKGPHEYEAARKILRQVYDLRVKLANFTWHSALLPGADYKSYFNARPGEIESLLRQWEEVEKQGHLFENTFNEQITIIKSNQKLEDAKNGLMSYLLLVYAAVYNLVDEIKDSNKSLSDKEKEILGIISGRKGSDLECSRRANKIVKQFEKALRQYL